MKMLRETLVILAINTIIMSMNLAMAANYTVGAPNGGWDQSTDLQAWASSITFLTGDNLIFHFTLNHEVTEVSRPDFDSCSSSNPLQPPITGGVVVIPLTSAGSRYFICGTAGHCLNGMKIRIDTLAASAPPPSTTPSVPSPPPTTTPSVPSPPPATTPSVPSPPPTPTPAVSRPAPAPRATPPVRNTAPSPSPKHSPHPAPKVSPSKAPAAVTTPAASPPADGSVLQAQPPASTAAKCSMMSALSACSGFLMLFFLNL